MSSITSLALCAGNTSEELQHTLDSVVKSGAQSLLILACDADLWTPAKVDTMLTRCTVPMIGGIFPNIIYKGRHLNRGTLVVGLAVTLNVIIVDQLSAADGKLEQRLREHAPVIAAAQGIITIVDGLARNIERFVEALYGITGIGPDTVGCGAGSLDFFQKPCLFTQRGLIQDAAVIGVPATRLYRGVKHGWEILDGPYLVTGSHGNVLDTLNYLPAYTVYRDHVERASGRSFADNDFFSMAKTYPLGIERLDGEILVRDPIRVDGQSLVCVGEVPENTMVYLLKGQADQLIRSAGEAAAMARASYADDHPQSVPSAMIFDCISRVLFLDQHFDRELQSIQDQLGHFDQAFGALTLGEICNTRNGPIDLLNKSTVIAVF